MLPKKIHYCWFGNNPLPDDVKKCIESWKKFCPNYEIIEWNEKNYDINKSNFVKEAYCNKKWAFVSDYSRLDIIYNEGGIYLDTDVELIKPLDDFLKNDAFMAFESKEYVATGLKFGAIKGNNIIRENLDFYDNIHFVNFDGTLNMINCPIITTNILKKHGLKLNNKKLFMYICLFVSNFSRTSLIMFVYFIFVFKVSERINDNYEK